MKMIKYMPRRMWINQPSTLDDHHKLHGVLVLAVQEAWQDQQITVYFISGKRISGVYPKSVLSEGWPEHLR